MHLSTAVADSLPPGKCEDRKYFAQRKSIFSQLLHHAPSSLVAGSFDRFGWFASKQRKGSGEFWEFCGFESKGCREDARDQQNHRLIVSIAFASEAGRMQVQEIIGLSVIAVTVRTQNGSLNALIVFFIQ